MKDGGPAYPLLRKGAPDYLGMSLRDYFAGQALTMMRPDTRVGLHNDRDNVASTAYLVADAMLKAREA